VININGTNGSFLHNVFINNNKKTHYAVLHIQFIWKSRQTEYVLLHMYTAHTFNCWC